MESQIIFGDCMEELPKLPDKCVDVIITDPPYNVTKEKWDKYDVFTEDLTKELYRILKDKGSIYIWCGIGKKSNSLMRWFPLLNKLFVFQNLITWKKQRGYGVNNNWMFTREEIMFFTKSEDYKFNVQYTNIKRQKYGFKSLKKYKPKSEYLRTSNVWTDINERGFDYIHKHSKTLGKKHYTIKPTKCMERLILASSNEGDIVLDCFAGCGTVMMACIETNRKYVMIEKEKMYYNMMVERAKNPTQERDLNGNKNK